MRLAAALAAFMVGAALCSTALWPDAALLELALLGLRVALVMAGGGLALAATGYAVIRFLMWKQGG